MLAGIDLAGLWKYIDRGLCIVGFCIVVWWLIRWLWTFINKQRELWAIQETINKNLREGLTDSQNRIDNIKAGAAEQIALQEFKANELKNQLEAKDGELATLKREHEILWLWSRTAEIYVEKNTEETEDILGKSLYQTVRNIGISSNVSPKRALEIMDIASRGEPPPAAEPEAAIYWVSKLAFQAALVFNVGREAVRFPHAVLNDAKQNPDLDTDTLAERLQLRWEKDKENRHKELADRKKDE